MSEPQEGNISNNTEKKELSELVTALKDAVMELRETVAELTNPLNRLSQGPEHVVTQPTGEYHDNFTPQNLNEEHRPKMPNLPLQSKQNYPVSTSPEADKEMSPSLMIPSVSEKSTLRLKKSKINLKRITKLLKLVFELGEKVHPGLIEKYVDIFVGLGLISKEEADILRNLLKVVDEGYKHGLEAEDHLALLMLLAKSLGIEDEELEEEGMRLLIKTITKEKEVNRASDSSRELEES